MGSTISSRFNLVGHIEVNADGREGHQVACLGPRFQIEFDVSFEPEWEEDCALGGFLMSIRVLIADCISPAASWLCVLLYSCHCRRCRVGGAGRCCGACSEDTSSTSGATQRRWNRARLALHVMPSMTASLPSLLPRGLWSTVLANRAIPALDYGVAG